jgi:hypothetical protein
MSDLNSQSTANKGTGHRRSIHASAPLLKDAMSHFFAPHEVDLTSKDQIRRVYVSKLREFLEKKHEEGLETLFLQGPSPPGFADALKEAILFPGCRIPVVIADL